MIRKVLVVRFRRVGDAVVSSVICNTLRLNFPDAEIHYVLNEAIAPLCHYVLDDFCGFTYQRMTELNIYNK